MERWATFDCYGTLIDWNEGIRQELERLFGVAQAPRLLERYHELEPVVEEESYRSYRDVLTLTLARIAAEEGVGLAADERAALAQSLPSWEPFPEVRAALAEARRRGWRLGILSNTDRDFLEASMRRLGVHFDLTIVAQDVRSYKPGHAHWQRFFEETGAGGDRHVHVGASLFHDIAPANELGLRSIWINRLGEQATAPPARELRDLSPLSEALDELAPT